MKKYEYKYVDILVWKIAIKEINKLGFEGWEVVGLNSSQAWGSITICLLKREFVTNVPKREVKE